jgi:hypothetical protein
MSGDKLKITLDTNCIINLFDHESETATSLEALSSLIRHGLSGKVSIAATTRVEEDISNDKNKERRAEMLRFLELLPIVGTIGRFDTSKWGQGDVFSDDRLERLHGEVKQIVFPGLTESDRRYRNKINDVDHIVGHMLNRRDIFVTDDNDILRRRDQLKIGPGIVVMTPDECLKYVDEVERRQVPQTSLRKASTLSTTHQPFKDASHLITQTIIIVSLSEKDTSSLKLDGQVQALKQFMHMLTRRV